MPPICCNARIGRRNDFAGLHPATLAVSTLLTAHVPSPHASLVYCKCPRCNQLRCVAQSKVRGPVIGASSATEPAALRCKQTQSPSRLRHQRLPARPGRRRPRVSAPHWKRPCAILRPAIPPFTLPDQRPAQRLPRKSRQLSIPNPASKPMGIAALPVQSWTLPLRAISLTRSPMASRALNPIPSRRLTPPPLHQPCLYSPYLCRS